MSRNNAPHTGRFAPSPTGPLHFGSLLTAVASFAQARVNAGRWLLRIEDIDPPREVSGADQLIIDALEAFGLEWDGPVIYQSRANERHADVVKSLIADRLAYKCTCSRRDLADVRRGALGAIYPGTCRAAEKDGECAIRIRTTNGETCVEDQLQGRICQRLESESGDFIIRRRDGLIAYHLAVVLDDADEGVTEVVRGIDLLDSTPRHVFLQQSLGLATPSYAHIPVALNTDGQKLSKLTGAAAVDLSRPALTLVQALAALSQDPPSDLSDGTLADVWEWTLGHWNLQAMLGERTIAADRCALEQA